MRAWVMAAAAFAAFIATPAQARVLTYTATLSGHVEPTNTGSEATGAARIGVNTDTQTIDARIEIHGLTIEQLSQHLAHSRMGPMHLHRYQSDDVTLILPFPLGASPAPANGAAVTYASTADGFAVEVQNYPYADGAERTGSHLTFEQFLAALAADPIFLNLHTQRFGDGEISGRIQPAG